jgi:hypothetical protein
MTTSSRLVCALAAAAAAALASACAPDDVRADTDECLIVPFTSGYPARSRRAAAHVFERRCPGSPRPTWNVSIQPGFDMPNSDGNVFVAEDSGGVIEASGRRFIVVANWLDSTRLQVGYDERARVIKSVPELGGVRIELRPLSANPQ